MTHSGGPAAARRFKICHVITCLELGGAQQNTLHTVTHLDRGRFEVALVSGVGGLLDKEAGAVADLALHWVPELVREIRPLADLAALAHLTSIFRAMRPDVVHTHSSKAGILGRWAAHLAGVPVRVHTIHGFGFHAQMSALQRGCLTALEAGTAPLTTRFIAVSNANLERGVAAGIFARGQATLLRSGVALGAFRNGARRGSLRADLGIPPEAPLVGMVACLKPQKAPLDFVRVAGQVAALVPEAHFLLVGDGALRGAVEEAIEAHSLAGRFHLLGWRRDIPSILKNLSLVALTSRWEGLPRIVPEAMAAALPVVATRVDGTPEAVEEGVTGFLAEPGDTAAMAARIGWLLRHPEQGRRMGRAGRERVDAFDIDAMVRRQESLYAELLAHA